MFQVEDHIKKLPKPALLIFSAGFDAHEVHCDAQLFGSINYCLVLCYRRMGQSCMVAILVTATSCEAKSFRT